MYEDATKQVHEHHLPFPLLGLGSLLPDLFSLISFSTNTNREGRRQGEKRRLPIGHRLFVCPATLPPSEFAIHSQLFGGWERRFTTLAGAIHKFNGSIHKFWQGNGAVPILCRYLSLFLHLLMSIPFLPLLYKIEYISPKEGLSLLGFVTTYIW